VADWDTDHLNTMPKANIHALRRLPPSHVPLYATRSGGHSTRWKRSSCRPVKEDDRDDGPPSLVPALKLPEPGLKFLQGRRAVETSGTRVPGPDQRGYHLLGRVVDAAEGRPAQDGNNHRGLSDHGWHLGENGHHGKKNTLWERLHPRA